MVESSWGTKWSHVLKFGEKAENLWVHNGDRVYAGDILLYGFKNFNQILEIFGEAKVAEELLYALQQDFEFRGVSIEDRHLELVIAQMLRYVKVLNPGSTAFSRGDIVEKWHFNDINLKFYQSFPASAELTLTGVSEICSCIQTKAETEISL